jgi:membrane-associated phospholipid phosphatase
MACASRGSARSWQALRERYQLPRVKPVWALCYVAVVVALVLVADPVTTPAFAALERADNSVGLAIGTLPGPTQLAAQCITRAFTAVPLLLIAAVVWLYALANERLRTRRLLGTLLLGALLQALATEAIKAVAGRQRPDGLFGAGGWGDVWQPFRHGASFPSGHAAFAFMAAAVFSAYCPRGRAGWYAAAALVALSRCVLVRHNLSDVVAAAGLGWYVGAIAVLARPPLTMEALRAAIEAKRQARPPAGRDPVPAA